MAERANWLTERWLRLWVSLSLFPSARATIDKGVHFFDSSIPKSAPSSFFGTFWLGNVLRAATACNLSSLTWLDGSASAALASLLVDPPGPQVIGKTQCFATFLLRAPASSFFWVFFSSLIFFLRHFSSLALPTSAFPSVIVGNLISKLPSISEN